MAQYGVAAGIAAASLAVFFSAGQEPDPDRAVLVFDQGAHVARGPLRRREGEPPEDAVAADGEPVGVGADPELPVAGRKEGGGLVGGEAVRRPEGADRGPRDPLEPSARHRRPDRPRRVLRDGADVLSGEPLPTPEAREDPVTQAEETVRPGADPDAPLAILEEAPDVVGRELAGSGRLAGDFLSRDEADAATPGPGPEVAGVVHQERGDLSGRQGRRAFREDLPVGDPREAAAGRAGPDASRRMGRQGDDGVVRKSLSRRERDRSARIETGDAAPHRPGPDGPGAVDAERSDRHLGRTGTDPDPLEALAHAPEQPPVDGPDPERAPSVAGEGLDLQSRQTGLRAEPLEPAAGHPEEAASVRPDPERSVEVGEEREALLAVTITEGVAQTQEFMDRLGNGISARQGKILKQWYEHKFDEPDKENAYHMEYELRDAGPSAPVQKGMQVQIFTQKKVLYSLVFTADPAVYDANRATFLALVKSFELEP